MNKRLFYLEKIFFLLVVIFSVILFKEAQLGEHMVIYFYLLVMLLPLRMIYVQFRYHVHFSNRLYLLMCFVFLVHLFILGRSLMDPGFVYSNSFISFIYQEEYLEGFNFMRLSYFAQNLYFFLPLYLGLYLLYRAEVKLNIRHSLKRIIFTTMMVISLFILISATGFNPHFGFTNLSLLLAFSLEIIFMVMSILLWNKEKKLTCYSIINLILSDLGILATILFYFLR